MSWLRSQTRVYQHSPCQRGGRSARDAAAAEALGGIPDPRAIDALIAARDPDFDGLACAVDQALARQGLSPSARSRSWMASSWRPSRSSRSLKAAN